MWNTVYKINACNIYWTRFPFLQHLLIQCFGTGSCCLVTYFNALLEKLVNITRGLIRNHKHFTSIEPLIQNTLPHVLYNIQQPNETKLLFRNIFTGEGSWMSSLQSDETVPWWMVCLPDTRKSFYKCGKISGTSQRKTGPLYKRSSTWWQLQGQQQTNEADNLHGNHQKNVQEHLCTPQMDRTTHSEWKWMMTQEGK